MLFSWSRGAKSFAAILFASAVLLTPVALTAQTCTQNAVTNINSTGGIWTLSPAIPSAYQTQVNPPIAADGSSNFSGKRGVIPVQFSLLTAPGAVTFQSIGSDGYSGFNIAGNMYSNDCSYLNFAPTAPFTFSQLTGLSAQYSFGIGNCQGGSLRWSITFANGKIMYIYYGADSGFWTDCKTSGSTTNQSTLNMINASYNGTSADTRYETPGASGVYVSYAAAAAWAASQGNITSVTLVLESGWSQCAQGQTTGCGDQSLTLGNVQVISTTNDVFSPPSGPASSTCTLPQAQIQVTQLTGSAPGAVNDVLSASAADTTGYFRVSACHYMYNLDVSSLRGAGTYSVSAVINNQPAGNPATFMLK